MYGVTIKTAPLKSSGNTGVAQHNDATATGYYDQKWLDPSIDPQSTGWDMGKDWHVIRYAEVLLTYAEAKNELTGLDASAFEAVNQVRRRVGIAKYGCKQTDLLRHARRSSSTYPQRMASRICNGRQQAQMGYPPLGYC